MTTFHSSPMLNLTIVVSGPPRGKGRPRFSTRGGFPRAYTDAKTREYEARIAMEAKLAMDGRPPVSGPVEVTIHAWFVKPKSWTKKRKAETGHHVVKPDVDNLVKATLDGIAGVIIEDDNAVCSLIATKAYDDDPRLEITIRERR